MTKTVEFFFDFMSPPTYLAYTQMPGILERTGASMDMRPMYTIGLHQITGNQSPIMVPNKGKWVGQDLARWVKRYGVEFANNPHQPVKVVPSLRGALVAEEMGKYEAYIDRVFKAMWTEQADIGDPATFMKLVAEIGLDPDAVGQRMGEADLKQKLMDNTQEAADRGAFGAPSFFVDGELYWGQDRLEFVEEALAA